MNSGVSFMLPGHVKQLKREYWGRKSKEIAGNRSAGLVFMRYILCVDKEGMLSRLIKRKYLS